MADPYAPNEDFQEGYDAGYETGYFDGMKRAREQSMNNPSGMAMRMRTSSRSMPGQKPKRKRKQSGKAALLTKMTAPKWAKYKKGNGKKTYVDIRAQVSRSQDYKRACKRKGFK
tara:strand:+ start:701 stop:1042 length:342 start_codon:yes stop_codon:yes gene_type:complete